MRTTLRVFVNYTFAFVDMYVCIYIYMYSLTQLAEARAQRRLIGCRTAGLPGCRLLLGLKSDRNRWEVLHFSKTRPNSFRFWHVMVTPLNVWAYFFSENVTPMNVWTSIFKDWDQQCPPVSVLACQCHTSQRLDQFCELEPGQHDTYNIYIYTLVEP